MTGQHIADLRHRTTGMDLAAIDDVHTSSVAWGDGAKALAGVAKALTDAAPEIRRGFGDGSTIGTDAHDAFINAGDRLSARLADLEDAEKALQNVQPAMAAARTAAAGAPDSSPGNPPPFPSTDGDGDEDAEIRALKLHAREMETYNNQVSAYADADENARKKVQDLKDRYNEAAEVFRRIHGEPDAPPPGGRNPGQNPGGGGVPPIGRPHTPYVPPPLHPTIPVTPPPIVEPPPPIIEHPPVPPVDPVHPPEVPPGYPPVDPVGPHVPGGPGGGGGGGGGVGPAVIGGVGAGVFGAPGLVNGIRGLLNGRGLSGSGGTIGSTTRAGGPGSLTRGTGGVGAPGSQVNRAGGRGAGGGRGGAAGGAGGRQGGRGRGGAAAGGGRRGERRRDDENGQERDLFDDGQDWLDDEGAAPGVLD